MTQLKELINERKQYLEKIIKEKKLAIKNAPQGTIHVMTSKCRTQYYHKMDSKDAKRKYLKNSQEPLVQALCQKEYDEKVLDIAEKEYYRIKMLSGLYETGSCEDIHEKLPKGKKRAVTPITLSDEEYVNQWLQKEYPRKPFAPNFPEYYTDNGERVRSKSEILIANMLKKHNIPYRYEAPLKLKGYGIIHPDFTVLNVRTRKEYYFEHLGKMDDPEYVEDNLQRIEMYAKNSILPGEKLILSHETLSRPLNTRNIEKIIEVYLK